MSKPVNMLWTSGWDSTFRLLQLLLLEKKEVQTYYIIDNNRKSTPVELKTMEKIRRLVKSNWPAEAKLMLPTKIVKKESIQPNDTITQQYWRMATKERLGIQYEWIARMAAEFGINDLELSIEARQNNFVWRNIRPFLERENPDDKTTYRLARQPLNPDVILFNCFRWPIIELTKLDMKAIATKHGFIHVLNKTWFCHKPTKIGIPCGVCMPCRIVVEDGMSHRLPMVSRARNFFEVKMKPNLKKTLQQATMLVSFMSA
ncbi:7-cyano-7-deazaguanine synthase [Pontibacter vulgaris]|uniref:7-cyano-7-deazaguanine synthase n=1 Tax=Pontibacter vulgaris TaxID=2905679 RepID=UPI001FA74692|nr:7-cyano-7-deazaguanine synthase [Pontibacter vulgaris]